MRIRVRGWGALFSLDVHNEGTLSNGIQMDARQNLERIDTDFDVPQINVAEPLTCPNTPSFFDVLSLPPSPLGSACSWGSLSTPPSPYGTGGSSQGSLAASSPATSSSEFYSTSEERYLFLHDGSATATTNPRPEVLPAVDISSGDAQGASTGALSQLQYEYMLSAGLPAFVNFSSPADDPDDRYDNARLWAIDSAGQALSSKPNVVWYDSQGLGLLDVRPGPYDEDQGDRATHPPGLMSDPGPSIFPGAFIDPRAPSSPWIGCGVSPRLLGVESAPVGTSPDHSWLGAGVGPSSAAQVGMPEDEAAIPVDVVKPEVASAKTKERSADRRTVEAKYSCHLPGCDGTFTKRHNLNSELLPTAAKAELTAKRSVAFISGHVRAHNNDRQYSCKWCSQPFVRPNDCKRHEKKHCKNHQPTE